MIVNASSQKEEGLSDMPKLMESTRREGIGHASTEHAARIAEVAAKREPITTTREKVEYFDALLLDIDWLARAAVRKELTYAKGAQGMMRFSLPVIGIPEIGNLLDAPAGYPAMIEPARRAEMQRTVNIERLDDEAGFIEYLTDTDMHSDRQTLESIAIFDHGWDQMPSQKYIQFYDATTGHRFREAHILYANHGQAAKMLDILFDPAGGIPIGYRQLEASLHVPNPCRVPFDDPFLTTGRGELTHLRHQTKPQEYDDEHMDGGWGAQETVTLCDRINTQNPITKMKASYVYGRLHLPPFSLAIFKNDPLSEIRLASIGFEFKERQESQLHLWELSRPSYPPFAQLAGKSLIEVSSLSLHNFQTGKEEALVKCRSL